MAKLTDEARRAIATGWDPHVQTMKEYARAVGVSERAVRKYRAHFRSEARQDVPAEHPFVPLRDAAQALQARLQELEAAVDAARAATAAARATLDGVVAACDVPAGTEMAGDRMPSKPAPVERTPMPPPGFTWF